ncbi:MAG: aldo/keto reductase [Clostridia bacterium]|nr:aldo/keto reductase [Clostridia bacterium]
MEYHKLGNSSLNVSRVALGTWGLGGGSVWTDGDSTVKDTVELLKACKDAGINYLDTAPVYGTGESERLLGEALKGMREDFFVQSKCSLNWRNDGGKFHYSRDGYTVNNDTSKEAVKKDVEGILERMQLSYIDSLIVHYVNRNTPVKETVEALEELVKEGKIRTYGLSNSKPEDLVEYMENGGHVSVVQEFFSVLSPFHGREYFDVCRKYNVTFQVYGVLEEGFLTGPEFLDKEFRKTDIRSRIPWTEEKYKEGLRRTFEAWKPLTEKYNCSYSNLAEAWALSQFENMSLLVGMRKPKSVKDNEKAVAVKLSDEDIRYMEEVVKDIQVEVLDK